MSFLQKLLLLFLLKAESIVFDLGTVNTGSKDGTIDDLRRCILLHFLTSYLGTVYTTRMAVA